MSAPASEVAVVGGGLAGLSAAVYLRRAGFDVRIYDPAPSGGKAVTLEPTPGWRVEWGPHSFTSRAYALFELADVLGIGDRPVRLGAAAGTRFLVRGGKLRRAPFGGALSVREGFGLVRGLFRRVADVSGESVRAWVARRFGEAFAAGPLDAMITGIWASDPATIEMEVAFPTVTDLVRSEGTVFRALRELRRMATVLRDAGATRAAGTWGFPGGMGELAAGARRFLGEGAFIPRAVTAIDGTPGAYTLHHAHGADRVACVVVATEAPAAAELLAGLAPAAAAGLREVRYAPLAVAHWHSANAAYPRGFGYLTPHAERRPVLGTIFVSDLFPSRAPAGHRSFATMLGGARRPEDVSIDTAEAQRRIEAEHLALTGRPVTVAGLHLVHHTTAVAPPLLGHVARLARIRAGLPHGVFVAGAWCGAGAMDDAVRSGREAAEAVSDVQ